MQKHIIKKLTFSLHFHSGAQAKQLEHDVINIYRRQIEQLLDEHFSKLAGSDVEYQIDKLELDLGRIKPENLRLEMPRRISEQLSKNLNNGLACTSDIVSEQEKQLSLFGHFLETGRAPWWTERFHRKTLEQLVEKLCINSPTEFKGLMLHVIKDERKIRRLINQLPDQCLYGISELYLSAYDVASIARQYNDIVALFTESGREKAIPEIYAPMQLSAGNANHGRTKLRGHYWQNVLISVAYGPANAFSCDQLLSDTLVSLTGNNDEAYCSLVAGLGNAVRLLKDGGYKFRSRLPGLIAEFATEMANLPEEAVPSPGSSGSDEDMDLTGPVTEINPSSSKKRATAESVLTGAAGQKILRDLPPQGDARDKHSLVTGSSTRRSSSSSKKRVVSERALTETARQTRLRDLPPQENTRDRRSLAMGSSTKRNSSSSKKRVTAESAFTGAARQKLLQNSSAQERAGVQPETIKDPFTDSNEDYIYNAGLVILWPYLPRLFLNLGLVDNDNFINMDAAERAALLLQYLVEPDTEMPEALLSLNKLLCGFELSWPLPADFTPTEREQGECDALLEAVTGHWDVLKYMSSERIRLDFFQRQGVLRARAGNWLLQVEQQTHDILMQKLPWPTGVVKLPWMDCTLLVHWG